jgi:hypothetical protein
MLQTLLDLTTTSSAITIGSASNLAKGTIEIDDELLSGLIPLIRQLTFLM